MSTWNKKNFSIYTSDERSALGLIEELGNQTNYNTEEIEKVKESDNKKVSHDEMNRIYKIDKNADFTGSWHGIKKPTASQEGLQGTVDKIVEEDIPNIYSHLDNNTNEIDYLRESRGNSKGYLEIPVYNSGSNQATHPSVLFFEDKWNGYHYWMAMTPYEKENESLENPSILVSNDGVIWEVPQGLVNPIDKTDNVSNYHLSDPHLVFVNNKIECWYRKRTRGIFPTNEIILRKTSSDGIVWTEAEVLHTTNVERADLVLSPVVIYEDSVYKIWVSNFKDGVLDYFETNTGKEWVKIRTIQKPKHKNGYKVWHMDIKHTTNGYEMYYCGGLDYKCYEICYSKSLDNITYSDPITVIKPSTVGFDEDRLYRPCFVDSWAGKRYIYYGAINLKNDWRIGLAIANKDNPTRLEGVKISNNEKTIGGNDFNILSTLKVWKNIIIGKYSYIKENAIKLVKNGYSGVVLKVSETQKNTLSILNDSESSLGNLELFGIKVSDIIGDTVIVKSTSNTVNPKLKIVKPNVAGVTITLVIDGLLEFKNDSGNDYTDIMIKQLLLKDLTTGEGRRVYSDNGVLKYNDGRYLQTISLIYSGNSNSRITNPVIGTMYFDITLGKPIWYKGNNVWVDSNGITV